MIAPRLRSVVAWTLFHRFHLLLAALFFGFPFFARGPAASLLANLFVLTFWKAATVALLATLVGHALVVTAWASTRNGPIRLWPGSPEGARRPAPGASERPGEAESSPDGASADHASRPGFRALRAAYRRSWETSHRWRRRISRLEPWIVLALAAPTLVTVFRASVDEGESLFRRLAAPALGWFVAQLVRLLAGVVTALLTPEDAHLGFVGGKIARRLAKLARRRAPRPAVWARDKLRTLFARPPFGPGYVWVDRDGNRFLHSGHLAALGMLAGTLLVYAVFGLVDNPARRDPFLPALGAVLLVLGVAVWLLPGLSFFLDRYRVPVVPSWLLVSALLWMVAGGDHWFDLMPLDETAGGGGAGAAKPFDPAEDEALIDSWFEVPEGEEHPRPIILVAAAGGGITASAWTATVLTGLASGDDGGDFLASLKVISGVSGGAVGAMHFLDRLPDEPLATMGPLSPERVEAIRNAASASSLDAVGWGLAYPDLLRSLFAFPYATLFPRIDRSWALEQSFRLHLEDPRHPPTLASWRKETIEERKPLFIASATSVETGERFEMATLDLGTDRAPAGFWETYPESDVDLPTASRLASTFPMVSVPARARTPKGSGRSISASHFVDGGYAENSGLLSVIELLDTALERRCGNAPSCEVPPIRILEIRAFSVADVSIPSLDRSGALSSSIAAPILTMMSVRTSSQGTRNRFELVLTSGRWSVRGVEVNARVLPLGDIGPLSWHLTRRERRSIVEVWRRVETENRSLD